MLHQFLLTASKQIQANRKQALEASHHEGSLQLLVLVFLLFAILLLFLRTQQTLKFIFHEKIKILPFHRLVLLQCH